MSEKSNDKKLLSFLTKDMTELKKAIIDDI